MPFVNHWFCYRIYSLYSLVLVILIGTHQLLAAVMVAVPLIATRDCYDCGFVFPGKLFGVLPKFAPPAQIPIL